MDENNRLAHAPDGKHPGKNSRSAADERADGERAGSRFGINRQRGAGSPFELGARWTRSSIRITARLSKTAHDLRTYRGSGADFPEVIRSPPRPPAHCDFKTV